MQEDEHRLRFTFKKDTPLRIMYPIIDAAHKWHKYSYYNGYFGKPYLNLVVLEEHCKLYKCQHYHYNKLERPKTQYKCEKEIYTPANL